MFQSLTWVERLSDPGLKPEQRGQDLFQSLTWVERLSDLDMKLEYIRKYSFNPSPGLNVFQTAAAVVGGVGSGQFQSLTWVERLSDLIW